MAAKPQRRTQRFWGGVLLLAMVLSTSSVTAQKGVADTVRGNCRGYLTTPQELAEIKQKADLNMEPYRSAVADLRQFVDQGAFLQPQVGAVTCKASDAPPYLTAGTPLVYGYALAYHLTGDVKYAEKARSGIRGLRSVAGLGEGDCPLTFGRHIPGWIRAADLLEDYWPKEEKRAFQDWLAAVVYPSLLTRYQRPNNWGAAITNAGQHIADYCADRPDLKLGDLSPADAYWRMRQQALDRMNGLCWEPDKCPEGKAMIRPDGGIPEEIRRTEGANCDETTLKPDTPGIQYTEGYLAALIGQAELCLRRGDNSIYENIMAAAGQTPGGVALPAGRGSLRRAILFVIEPPNQLEWDKKQSLMIAARYYRHPLMLKQARAGRPYGAAGNDKVNHFTTLTHDYAGDENPGPPPTVPPPAGGSSVPTHAFLAAPIVLTSFPSATDYGFADDFETELLGKDPGWTKAGTGSVHFLARTNTQAHSGSYALELDAKTAGGDFTHYHSYPAYNPLRKHLFARLYMKIGADYMQARQWDHQHLFGFNMNGKSGEFVDFGLSRTHTDQFALDCPWWDVKGKNRNAGSVPSSEYFLNRDRWYCVDVEYIADAFCGGTSMWIDGVLVLDHIKSGQDNTGREVGYFWVGSCIKDEGTIGHIFFDDIVLSDKYIGPMGKS